MTQIYGEYTTVYNVRTVERGSATTDTGQDALFIDLIRSTSQEIDNITQRTFYPFIQARKFNYTNKRELFVDKDLLEVTSITNGDGVAVSSSNYFLIDVNTTPYYGVRLKNNSTVFWVPASGEEIQAITITGVWGWHNNYDGAWQNTTATLAANISTTSATTFTCTTGLVRAGDTLKIDSEYFYVSSVATGASDTVTCVREINGSTAATHTSTTVIYRWYTPMIEMLCRQAVNAYERLKNNPVGESVSMDGQTFQTPKDVRKWLKTQLEAERLIRVHAHN